MKTLILKTDAGDLGTASPDDCHCAAVDLTAELLEKCRRRIELAKSAYAQDPALAKLCFQDPGGPEFYGDDLPAACGKVSDEFHHDYFNRGTAVMPEDAALNCLEEGRVACLAMVLWRYEYPDSVGFEIGWTAIPEDTNLRIATEAVTLEYLTEMLSSDHASSMCECEEPGYFCSGVPGILAHVENGGLPEGAEVERCDLCDRYASDEAARAKLRELGIA